VFLALILVTHFPSAVLIGEIVQQTGVSRDTIRYYEKLGLLPVPGRPSPFNNYKAYAPGTPGRLALIQRAKNLGFTLSEIAKLLPLWESQQLPTASLAARISEKLAVIEGKIHRLEAMRANLRQSLADGQAGCHAAPTPSVSTCPPGKAHSADDAVTT